jgi:hypothetical protein
MAKYPSLTYQQYPEVPGTVGVGNQKLDGVGSSKMPLSSSLGGIFTGAPLAISASSDSTTFTQIHTFSYGVVEELYLWCSNPTGANVELTMSVESPSSTPSFPTATNIIVDVATKAGLILVYPGMVHTGNNIGTTSMFLRAASATSLNVNGFVVRSYPFPGKDTDVYGFFNSSQGG